MQFSTTTALIISMLGLATADFYIYAETAYSVDDGFGSTRADGYKFYGGPPSCDDVNTKSIFQHSTEDASYSGIRCPDCASAQDGGGPPTLLEWNNDMGHFTWYADRNGDFVDTDGNVQGNCVVDMSDDYTCGDPFAVRGLSQLFCTSSHTADEVN